MLRVWACVVHIGGFSGPKFSKSPFQQIFLKHGLIFGLTEVRKKIFKMGIFPQGFTKKWLRR